jgi:N-acetylglutamate synthase-like GNAT family acetyltransferase
MIVGAQHIRLARQSELTQIAHLIHQAHAERGEVSSHYQAASVRNRLTLSLLSRGKILVAETEGVIHACGAITPAAFAKNTAVLSLGATRPGLQGRGIGHALVLDRLKLAPGMGVGTVLVSARNAARWSRYGFSAVSVNPISGASLMVLNLEWRK